LALTCTRINTCTHTNKHIGAGAQVGLQLQDVAVASNILRAGGGDRGIEA
jgi:hypothetical protein